MRFGVVEGEPGIFPDPIARALRALARLITTGHRGAKQADDERQAPVEPADEDSS